MPRLGGSTLHVILPYICKSFTPKLLVGAGRVAKGSWKCRRFPTLDLRIPQHLSELPANSSRSQTGVKRLGFSLGRRGGPGTRTPQYGTRGAQPNGTGTSERLSPLVFPTKILTPVS